MLVQTIGIFKVSILSIYTFIFGIALGLAIATIIYLLYVLRQMNSAKFKEMTKIKTKDYEFNPSVLNKKEKVKFDEFKSSLDKQKQVCALILEYEEIFNDKELRKGRTNFEFTKYLSWSLIQNVAHIYNPKSKRPYLDITISDATNLLRYASKRMDEILDFNGLRILRRININTFRGTFTFYKRVYDFKLVKLIYKYKLNKILFGFKVLINIINPLYWVRKFVINSSFEIITRRICVNVIQIIGEEAYNIYSKNAFDKGVVLIEN